MKEIKLIPVFLDIETTGLSALEGHIVAIGVKIGNKDELDIIRICRNEEEEIRAIAEVLGFVIQPDNKLLVGYNINFDLSFIACRAAILTSRRYGTPEDRIRVMEYQGMLRELYRVDLMHVVSRYWLNGARKSLDEVCRAIGLEFDDVKGSEIPALVEVGEWGEIQKHLECDLARLKYLFDYLNRQNLIEHNIRRRYNLGDTIIIF